MTNAIKATSSSSYADFLYQQERKNIQKVRIRVSHDEKERDREIFARTIRIKELEQADPAIIQDECEKIIRADTNPEALLAALYMMLENMQARGYQQQNRDSIKQSLTLLRDARMNNAYSMQIASAIHRIGNMHA